MTEAEALIALNTISGVGSSRLKKLLEAFGSASRIFLAREYALKKVDGIGDKISGEISGFHFENLKKELDLAKKLKVNIVTFQDKEYPGNLKSIYDPPLCLYLKGGLLESDTLSLAVVGSRRASFYGLSCAEKFSYALANLGITIVSGLARGIDTQAHKGALKAKGRTIAVLGSGLNCIYPSENKKLADDIACSGAVISEFPLNARPLAQNFPRRNRVISGLSQGVMVVEAARNSGALITADFALEQGRDVFAIPGKVDSATSFGTNQLIKQGAKLIDSIEDIIEELKPKLAEYIEKESGKTKIADTRKVAKERKSSIQLSEEEGLIYSLLDSSPRHADELIEESGLSSAKVMAILLKLEMRKSVKQLPGKMYIREVCLA